MFKSSAERMRKAAVLVLCCLRCASAAIQDSSLLQDGVQEICPPGSKLAGCAFVQSFNSNDNCKVYIVQVFDTFNSVASSLNLSSSDLQKLNSDAKVEFLLLNVTGLLQPEAKLRLPPWNTTCGYPNPNDKPNLVLEPKTSPNNFDSPPIPPPSPVTTTSSSSSDTGMIVGIVIGVIAGVALIAAGGWYAMKKRRLKQPTPAVQSAKDADLDKYASAPPITIVDSKTEPETGTQPPLMPSAIYLRNSEVDTKSIPPSSNASETLSKDPLLSLIASTRSQKTNTSSSDIGAPLSGPGSSARGSGTVDVRAWQFSWDELQIVDTIGEGSYGKVYKAIWHNSNCAVKVLLDMNERTAQQAAITTLSSPMLAGLSKEATLMATTRHPNIVAFLGVCLSPPAIASEFCERGSLTTVLRAASTSPSEAAVLTWNRRVSIALDAAKGMTYLHNHKPQIIHRDFKSPNLLIDEHWRAKVCDFNLSKLVEEATTTSSAGGAMNPRWLAPEVLAGGSHTAAADVYAFGVVLWELLTFSIPWSGPNVNPWQIVSQVMNGARLPIPPKKQLPGPKSGDWKGLDGYIKLMEECWHQNPEKRPSFNEIVVSLRELLEQT